MSHHPSHPQAPPSPPQTPRSPPISYAISTRHQSFDEGGASMDENMMMRNIWLKLGLLDTINYKIDATLKKLGTLENRMDRLENLVRESATVGGASGGGTQNETRNDSHETQPNGINLPDIMSTSSKDPISPAPRKLPKPAKRHPPNPKPLVPIRPAPTAVPTAIPTVISQVAATPISPPPAPIIIDNVLPRSCTLHTTNKEECENKLRAHQHNGMYLIRNSEKAKGKVLMVWFHETNSCKHYKIFGNQTSCFQLDETPSFSSMVDLLHHYSQHTLPQSNVLLTRPFPG